jgi:hypothetical protein
LPDVGLTQSLALRSPLISEVWREPGAATFREAFQPCGANRALGLLV